MVMIPRDQMSTFGPYCFLVTTSGAIQYGVPTIVDLLDCSGVIWAQNPKSAGRQTEGRGGEGRGGEGRGREKRRGEKRRREGREGEGKEVDRHRKERKD